MLGYAFRMFYAMRQFANYLTWSLLVGLGSSALGSSLGYATAIVDTGQPSAEQGGWTLQRDQFGNYTYQAQKFELIQGTEITSVQAWLYGVFNDYANTLTAVLYDSSPTGAPGTALYKANFPASYAQIGWYGPSGLDWVMGQGSYWLAIEVPDTNVFFGALPFDAPQPLQWFAMHAFQDGVDYPYNPMLTDAVFDTGNASFGLRIDGEAVATVPEPPTLALLAIAICAASRIPKKQRVGSRTVARLEV